MDLHDWIRSLPIASLRELKNAIADVEAARNAGAEPLTFDEEEMVKSGRPIEAVKSYRNRMSCDLRAGVIAVRLFQSSLPTDHPMFRDPSTVGL